MKRFIIIIAVSFACIALCAQQMPFVQKIRRAGDKIYLEDRGELFEINKNIITVKPKYPYIINRRNLNVYSSNKLGFSNIFVPKGIDIVDYVEELKATGEFETVEYNGFAQYCLTPNDANISSQWHLNVINAFNAWNITTGSPNIKVGIIDTGVDAGHEELGYGNSNYSQIDTTNGWDYTHNTNYTTPTYYHGTFVAGIIAAKTNNSIGIAGITGGNNSKGVTILSFCTSNSSVFMDFVDIPNSIVQAVDKGSKVINMSFFLSRKHCDEPSNRICRFKRSILNLQFWQQYTWMG